MEEKLYKTKVTHHRLRYHYVDVTEVNKTSMITGTEIINILSEYYDVGELFVYDDCVRFRYFGPMVELIDGDRFESVCTIDLNDLSDDIELITKILDVLKDGYDETDDFFEPDYKTVIKTVTNILPPEYRFMYL